MMWTWVGTKFFWCRNDPTKWICLSSLKLQIHDGYGNFLFHSLPNRHSIEWDQITSSHTSFFILFSQCMQWVFNIDTKMSSKLYMQTKHAEISGHLGHGSGSSMMSMIYCDCIWCLIWYIFSNCCIMLKFELGGHVLKKGYMISYIGLWFLLHILQHDAAKLNIRLCPSLSISTTAK